VIRASPQKNSLMKITYLGNFSNKFSDLTEEHIKFVFEELGHKVILYHEKDFDIDKLVELTKTSDLFFFHKGGVAKGIELSDLIELLNKITCKKVFWYFDKVERERELWMQTVAPYVDYGFLTDETWLRRNNYPNLSILRQGIGNEDIGYLPKEREEYKCDIAFVGNIYEEERLRFVNALKEVYGDKFKIFNNVFGKDLMDLCASVKIIVAPIYPSNEFYWSNRIYLITGSGGFIIHPLLEGLKEEFTNGAEFVGYKTGEQLKSAIDFFLLPENEDKRKIIQKQGYKKTIGNYTLFHRIELLLKKIK